MLERKPGFLIIAEASEGLEAVRKAEELHPDLVVLDIGLPGLNGIEAARRIHKISSATKIVVLTQESSATVVEAVLAAGALGYVVKAHAGRELLEAVEAVSLGRQYVSRAISGQDPFGATEKEAPQQLNEAAPYWLAPRIVQTARTHEVEFYSDDACFLNGFSRFIETNLIYGNAVIVVASHFHQISLLERLRAQRVNIDAAIEQKRYIALDVTDTLSLFMVNDLPDRARFLKAAGDLIAAAAKAVNGNPFRVAACGECAPTLWAQGNSEAAVQLEHLWDEVARSYRLSILCGYMLKTFQSGQASQVYQRICAEHSSVHTQYRLKSP